MIIPKNVLTFRDDYTELRDTLKYA